MPLSNRIRRREAARKLQFLQRKKEEARLQSSLAKSANTKRAPILESIYRFRQAAMKIFEVRWQKKRILHKQGADPEKLEAFDREMDLQEAMVARQLSLLEQQLGDVPQETIQPVALPTKTPAARTKGRRKNSIKGAKVQVPAREVSPSSFSKIIKSAQRAAILLKSRGGGLGKNVSQKVYNYASKGKKFTIHTLEGDQGVVSISATYSTSNGSKSFSAQRSAM